MRFRAAVQPTNSRRSTASGPETSSGVHRAARLFEGQARSKVESIARSLERGSIEAASNEVLTDGTTWPILAPLLPEDTSALNALSDERPALRGVAAWRALSGAVSKLWDWDWEGAVVEAKRCLLVARDEQTRDEALNLIACAEWQLGDDADAIAALSLPWRAPTRRAAGEHRRRRRVRSSLASPGEHLGSSRCKAPTLALRVAAASRALELWYADPDPWDTEEGEHAFPLELRDALRELVRSDIDEAVFVRFRRTMSRWDEDWLATEASLERQPVRRVRRGVRLPGEGSGLREFVKTLAGVVGAGRSAGVGHRGARRPRRLGDRRLRPEATRTRWLLRSGSVLIDNGLPDGGGRLHRPRGFHGRRRSARGSIPRRGNRRSGSSTWSRRPATGSARSPTDEQERSGKLLDFAA